MQLSEKFFSFLPTNLTYQSKKFFTVFTDETGKKAYLSGKRIQLLDYDSSFGEKFVQITEDEAKQKHLGKVRCLGVASDEYDALVVFSKYFKFSTPPVYFLPKVITEKKKKEKYVVKKAKKLELKTDQEPCDRDENELIIKYRAAVDKRQRDKIFRVILFQRGVKGKTWDTIIKNYVSFNKPKYAHILDRDENDFYQDIVIALNKQIETWFDPKKGICFSTYAWYVINCSFNRVLQLLGTQKRKVQYLKNNIDLDNDESAWDESISTESTHLPQVSFESEIEQRDLCKVIQKMFALQKVKAPEDLKQDILSVIRNKSTMQNSLYSIAKKYNKDIEEIFKLEMILRENLKNAMYNDIILSMQHDVNSDEVIAKKFKRSKGHVIKMKRQLSSIVKTKMKSMTF